MEIVDKRASEVELPAGLTVLSPEEVTAKEEEVPVEATVEEQEAALKAAYEEAIVAAKKQEEEIRASLEGIGTYVLIRFQDPLSIRRVAMFSDPRPQDRTVIAVLEGLVRELKAYEQRAFILAADAADQKAKEEETEAIVTQEILKRGLPNNRATRRKLAQDLGL